MIFIYSLLFTSLVSFFAVMIIPHNVRPNYFANLIGGITMYLVGPTSLKLVFHAFVVRVGVLILAGAQNTAIVGANGVLNRVAEDGVLTVWFQKLHNIETVFILGGNNEEARTTVHRPNDLAFVFALRVRTDFLRMCGVQDHHLSRAPFLFLRGHRSGARSLRM